MGRKMKMNGSEEIYTYLQAQRDFQSFLVFT